MSQRLMALAALAWSCRPRAPCLRGGRCDFNIASRIVGLTGDYAGRRKIGDEWMSRTKVCMNLQPILNFVQSKWAAGSGIWTMFSPRVVLIFGKLSTRLINVRWRHRIDYSFGGTYDLDHTCF